MSSRVKYFGSGNFESVSSSLKPIAKHACGGAVFRRTDYTLLYQN